MEKCRNTKLIPFGVCRLFCRKQNFQYNALIGRIIKKNVMVVQSEIKKHFFTILEAQERQTRWVCVCEKYKEILTKKKTTLL